MIQKLILIRKKNYNKPFAFVEFPLSFVKNLFKPKVSTSLISKFLTSKPLKTTLRFHRIFKQTLPRLSMRKISSKHPTTLTLISTPTDTQIRDDPFAMSRQHSRKQPCASVEFPNGHSEWPHLCPRDFLSRSIIDPDATLLPARHRTTTFHSSLVLDDFSRRGGKARTACWPFNDHAKKEIHEKRHNMNFTADSTGHNAHPDPDVLTFVRSLTIAISFSSFCASSIPPDVRCSGFSSPFPSIHLCLTTLGEILQESLCSKSKAHAPLRVHSSSIMHDSVAIRTSDQFAYSYSFCLIRCIFRFISNLANIVTIIVSYNSVNLSTKQICYRKEIFKKGEKSIF